MTIIIFQHWSPQKQKWIKVAMAISHPDKLKAIGYIAYFSLFPIKNILIRYDSKENIEKRGIPILLEEELNKL